MIMIRKCDFEDMLSSLSFFTLYITRISVQELWENTTSVEGNSSLSRKWKPSWMYECNKSCTLHNMTASCPGQHMCITIHLCTVSIYSEHANVQPRISEWKRLPFCISLAEEMKVVFWLGSRAAGCHNRDQRTRRYEHKRGSTYWLWAAAAQQWCEKPEKRQAVVIASSVYVT